MKVNYVLSKVESYSASIYVGLKERDSGITHQLYELNALCQEYVDKKGLCVTVTPTYFMYTDGNEPGAIVGLINYPRFPSSPEIIKETAIELASIILNKLDQYRISIDLPGETLMLSNSRKV
jgi:hypothetical protein